MTTRKLSLGLYGPTYFGQFNPLLNWWKIAGIGGGAGDVVIERSSSADIADHDAYVAGYLDIDHEVSPTAPTDATYVKGIFYSQYSDMYYSGIPPMSGEVFQVSWTGVAGSVSCSSATVSNVTANSATITLATPASNTTIKLGISNHANPPRNIAIVQDRYVNNVTLNGVTYLGWSNGGKYNPHWLDQLRNFKCIRFMDMMFTNWSPVVNFSDFATESYARIADYKVAATFGGEKHGFPLSMMCEIATLTGCDIHINIPHLASNACVAAMAAFFRDNFPHGAGQKVWVEYSNECWNTSFDQTKYLRGDAALGSYTGGNPAWVSGDDDSTRTRHRYGFRASEVLKIWRDTYGTSNRSQWRGILGTQNANSYPTNMAIEGFDYWKSSTGSSLVLSDLFNAIHGTGYFDVTSNHPSNPTLNPTADMLALRDASLSRFNSGLEQTKYDYFARQAAEAFRTGTCSSGLMTVPSINLANLVSTYWPAQKAIADFYGLAFGQYEGGCHWLVSGSALIDDVNFMEYYLAACHHEEMARVYELSYAAFIALGGEYPSKFVEGGATSRSGSWGGIRYFPSDNAPSGDFGNPVWQAVTRATSGKARIKLS